MSNAAIAPATRALVIARSKRRGAWAMSLMSVPRTSALDEEDSRGSTVTAFELDRTAARWCVDRGMKLVGIDYLSIEPQGPEKEGYPTHKTLLGAQIVIIEGLDLKDVRAGEYDLACGAIKFEGGDGAPARVFLIER